MKHFYDAFDRCEEDYLSPIERETECRHKTVVSSCCDARIFDEHCGDCENKCWEFCEDCELLLRF